MSTSVEVRVPLLDEDVVDVALGVPDRFKVAGATGKAVLKRAAKGLVPQEILARPKTGFGAPVRTWMRELSSEVLRDCLSAETIRRRGLVRADAVNEMRAQLVQGRSDQSVQLWAVAILELWARRFLDQPVVSRVS